MNKLAVCFFIIVSFLGTMSLLHAAPVKSGADVINASVISSAAGCTLDEAKVLLQEAKILIAQAREAGKTDREILAACQDVYTKMRALKAADFSNGGKGGTNFWDVAKVMTIGSFVVVIGLLILAVPAYDRFKDACDQEQLNQRGLAGLGAFMRSLQK